MIDALVVGNGEVGRALSCVLSGEYDTRVIDLEPNPDKNIGDVQFMHICFPYSDAFVQAVRDYQERYKPVCTVIHSTVPVGTCAELGAVHSPVVGKHPNLVRSLQAFTKFVGGEQACKVSEHLNKAGIKCYVTDKAETTELMKLLSTLFYGVCIEFTREVANLCGLKGIPFEAWTLWTTFYNQGYGQMGYQEYTRPLLIPPGPGPLGGHCIYANTFLLDENDFTKLVQERAESQKP